MKTPNGWPKDWENKLIAILLGLGWGKVINQIKEWNDKSESINWYN